MFPEICCGVAPGMKYLPAQIPTAVSCKFQKPVVIILIQQADCLVILREIPGSLSIRQG